MINLNHQNEWQHRDPSNGLIFPWYTKRFLDELAIWDLKDKVVFEYGCGASSLWWADKCKQLYGVESNKEYYTAVRERLGGKPAITFYDNEQEYTHDSIYMWSMQYDIVVIDGDPVEWRDECISPAIRCLKSGGILICDNWQQPEVWLPEQKNYNLLTKYEHKIFKQPNHPTWQTAYFIIP